MCFNLSNFFKRDVKPGNFAIGNRDEDLHRLIFMIDFGLSRKYTERVSTPKFVLAELYEVHKPWLSSEKLWIL